MKLQHSPVDTTDFREQSQDSFEDKTRRLLNTGSLTGTETNCEISKDRRRDNAKTTVSTRSSALLDITSTTPAQHGGPNQNGRRSSADQRSSERTDV